MRSPLLTDIVSHWTKCAFVFSPLKDLSMLPFTQFAEFCVSWLVTLTMCDDALLSNVSMTVERHFLHTHWHWKWNIPPHFTCVLVNMVISIFMFANLIDINFRNLALDFLNSNQNQWWKWQSWSSIVFSLPFLPGWVASLFSISLCFNMHSCYPKASCGMMKCALRLVGSIFHTWFSSRLFISLTAVHIAAPKTFHLHSQLIVLMELGMTEVWLAL